MQKCGQTLGLCWGSIQDAGLFELAEAASVASIGLLAITAGHFLDVAAAGVQTAEIRVRLAGLGVRVSVIDPLISALPGTPIAADVSDAMRRLFEFTAEDCWRAGEALGADIINMTHFLGKAVPMAQLQDALAALAEQNHIHGFDGTIEFIPGTAIPDLATAARIVADVPHLRIMFDMWHFARSGGTPVDIDALPPGVIGGAQLNDWSPPEPGALYVPMSGRLLPGDGCLPLSDILQRIEANSPGLDIGIEVFNADLAALGHIDAVRLMAERSAPLLVSA